LGSTVAYTSVSQTWSANQVHSNPVVFVSSTQFNGVILATGTVQVTTNTILPGTTFYQSGQVNMGVTGTTVSVTGGFISNSANASTYAFFDANKQLVSTATVTTTNLVGILAAAQFPVLTGAVTTSAGSLATTAAVLQPSIATLSASSITITGANGLKVSNYVLVAGSENVTGAGGITSTYGVSASSVNATYGVTAGTAAFYTTSPTSSALVVQSTNNATAFSVSNSSVTAGDNMLLISSSTVGNAILAVNTYGHLISSGTTPTAGSCGTLPHILANSTDMAGAITWTGAATSCAMTFANAYTVAPWSVAVSTGSTPIGVTSATSGLTFNFASLTGSTITWVNIGSAGN
jgi:hypothetical protein